jgi:hypothetical protein
MNFPEFTSNILVLRNIYATNIYGLKTQGETIFFTANHFTYITQLNTILDWLTIDRVIMGTGKTTHYSGLYI